MGIYSIVGNRGWGECPSDHFSLVEAINGNRTGRGAYDVKHYGRESEEVYARIQRRTQAWPTKQAGEFQGGNGETVALTLNKVLFAS